MKVTFLGTNGWYDTDTGNTVSVFVDAGDSYIILDAGFGFVKARSLIKEEKPVCLFISHLHLDHLIGLHTLPLFNVPQGIDIFTERRMVEGLRSFLRRPFTSPPVMLKTKLRFHDIAKKAKMPFDYSYARLQHSVPCYGYRFASGGKTLAYCTDTGLCGNLKRLAKGADLLIIECAMKTGDTSPNLFHVTPETAARVAKEAGSGELALFHFDPGRYPTFAEREAAEKAARGIFSNTIAARDGTQIYL